MKQFIILTAVDSRAVAIDIDSIITMHRELTGYRDDDNYTSIIYGNPVRQWNVKETVEEIIKRINAINNKLKGYEDIK